MASDGPAPGGFSKPPLKRALKKPPGADAEPEPQSSLGSFSPLDAKQAFNSPPSLILPFLYLGSQFNAASKKQLSQLQIKRILDLKERHVESDMADVIVHAVPMSDHGDTSISEILPDCFQFIEESRTNRDNVLVHCRGGVNRSATVVLAYLMKHHNMTLKDAWELVRNRRPSVQPVPDYMSQLRCYEEQLFGSVTLEATDVAIPLSLNQRIDAWRDMNRKNGSMPADLASNRSNTTEELSEEALSPDLATRANTSPIMRPKKGIITVTSTSTNPAPPSPSGSQDSATTSPIGCS